MNRIMLCGSTGKDPEVRKNIDGKSFANVSLATTERWKDKQGNIQEKTEWHRLVFSGGLADVVEKYVHKGDKLLVEGKITYRKYTNNDGKEVSITEIYVDNMEMLSNKGATKDAPQETATENLDDRIPF